MKLIDQTREAINVNSFRSYGFRNFRREFTQISSVNWYLEFSIRYTSQELQKNSQHSDFATITVTSILNVKRFPAKRLEITPSKFIADVTDNIDHLRMLLLVKACALLEYYLRQILAYTLYSRGLHGRAFNKLNIAGNYIFDSCEQNLRKLIDCLRDLSPNIPESYKSVIEAYKTRNAAAHSGGIIDGATAKDVPRYAKKIGQRITIDWPLMEKYLKAIYEVAEWAESTLAGAELKKIELNWLIQDIIDAEKITTAQKVRAEIRAIYEKEGIPSVNVIAERFNISKG